MFHESPWNFAERFAHGALALPLLWNIFILRDNAYENTDNIHMLLFFYPPVQQLRLRSRVIPVHSAE